MSSTGCLMLHVVFFLVRRVCSIQLIETIWKDDLATDFSALNGWKLYWSVTGPGSPNNYTQIPFVNGSLGKYYGVYSRSTSAVITHYLQRKFQCKYDSSIRIGYTMAYCGNEANDETHVHLDTDFAFGIDFIEPNRRPYSFNDNVIKSNYIGFGDTLWRVYYDTANPKLLKSFVAAQTLFIIKIEVILSTSTDLAAINNITLFCEPTSSPVIISNIITDVWYDDFLYDNNTLYGWDTFYIDFRNVEILYAPDVNPLINGDYTYHGIYAIDEYLTIAKHYMYRLFRCQHDSFLSVKYSVVYCGNENQDYIDFYVNGSIISETLLTDGASFSDMSVMNEGTDCIGTWTITHFVEAIDFVTSNAQFELEFKYTLSLANEFGALYNISIICNSSTAQPTTNSPTTANPTSIAPSKNPSGTPTLAPTTANPTSFYPTTAVPTTAVPTTTQPSNNPITNIPTTVTPTFNPTTVNPTLKLPMTSTHLPSTTSIVPTSSNITKLSDTISVFDNASETLDKSFMYIIIISAAILFIFVMVVCIICYKIYTKKKRNYPERIQSIEMNSSGNESIKTVAMESKDPNINVDNNSKYQSNVNTTSAVTKGMDEVQVDKDNSNNELTIQEGRISDKKQEKESSDNDFYVEPAEGSEKRDWRKAYFKTEGEGEKKESEPKLLSVGTTSGHEVNEKADNIISVNNSAADFDVKIETKGANKESVDDKEIDSTKQ